jgi:hypothetical protein
MNQQCDQDENIVGRALYELIKICNGVDLYAKNKEKGSPNQMIIK